MTVKDRIRELAKNSGISIPNLETEIGISKGIISRWDQYSPTSDKLAAVADYFKVSVDYLLGRESASGAAAFLSPDERRLLAFYRSMTQAGKDRLFEQAEMMVVKYVKKNMDNKDVIA